MTVGTIVVVRYGVNVVLKPGFVPYASPPWYDEYASYLDSLGFAVFAMDPAVFTFSLPGGHLGALVVTHGHDTLLAVDGSPPMVELASKIRDQYDEGGWVPLQEGEKFLYVGCDLIFSQGEFRVSQQSFIEEGFSPSTRLQGDGVGRTKTNAHRL